MNKVTEKRPWGDFVQFTHNEPTTVKIITVEPQQALSLQYHDHRSEFWKVLEGDPEITIGDNIIEAVAGDEFLVQTGEKHRIRSRQNRVKILEIAFGNFDEKDIVRLEDVYGRTDK